MKVTKIEWTDFSANPLKYRDKTTGAVVWACVKKSAGCANCYSEAIAHHYDRGGPFTRQTMANLTPFLDEKDLKQILTARTIGGKKVAGKRCFLGDMTDVFGEWVPDELLDRLFVHLALRPDVTFQILTKRPDRAREYIRGADGREFKVNIPGVPMAREPFDWPLPNVWLGTSVENQAAADERLPHLLDTPAAVRFLSCEPLLAAVKLCDVSGWADKAKWWGRTILGGPTGIGWVIVGGESGHGSRPMQVEWARSIVEQCRAAGVACFVKQLGARPFEMRQDPTYACEHAEERLLQLKDHKGGNPAEWPSDLRVRQFPA